MKAYRLAYFERGDFLENIWDYEGGEHVAAFEPTQQGKTYFLHQLLERTLAEHEGIRHVSLMPKPRDPATRYWAARLNLQITDTWPPPGRWPWQGRPAGHVLWPRHIKNTDAKTRREAVGAVLRKGLQDQYWHGNSITLADDAHVLAVLMHLNPDLEETLTNGGGMGSALWLANQKPSGSTSGALTTFAYSAPTHLILGKDKDERNIRRFSEIGGVDPDLVADQVRGLAMHRIATPTGVKNISDKLYLHKGGPWMCVIGP